MTKRTITLSDRPPVSIDETAWPTWASASDDDHDGQVRCQANRTSDWFVKVRRHADGRCIVYAGYTYSSNWANEQGYRIRHGVLLPVESSQDSICEAITEVCRRMSSCEHSDGDEAKWASLRDECIADMPAEELS